MNRLNQIKQAYYNVKANDNNSHLRDLSDEEFIKKILDSESKPVRIRAEKVRELDFN